MTPIICIIIGALAFSGLCYRIGEAMGRNAIKDEKEFEAGTSNFLEQFNTINRRRFTRYVTMHKDNLLLTNKDIREREAEGYTVSCYDTEGSLITMERIEDIPVAARNDTTVFIVTKDCDNNESRIIACFGTEKEAAIYIREKSKASGYRFCYEEWKVGETLTHEA